MKEYDLAFSMGFSCGGTMALRRAGLQFVSYPLDWIGAPGIVESARMIESGFARWFEKDDLKLFAVRGGTFNTNVYLNAHTHYGFPHDFSRLRRFDEQYPENAEKYARRIARFLADLRKAKTALVVYVERPKDARRPAAELIEARRVLAEKYPETAFDLVYFHRVEGAKDLVAETVADGITAVGCEYAKFDYGEISHAVLVPPLGDYLKANCRLTWQPDAAKMAEHAKAKKLHRKDKFACGSANPFVRKMNELKYRLYRRLESEMQEKGLAPRDYPLWFY